MKIILTNDGSYTLHCQRLAENYHSSSGAVTESRHVFLINSGVEQRLRSGIPTAVLEIGFGTGLNFLLTADQATKFSTGLDYVAVEQELVDIQWISRLNYRWLLDHPHLWDGFVRAYPNIVATPAGSIFRWDWDDQIALQLFHIDACQAKITGRFDAIYHDAFSPQSNPDLWSMPWLARLHDWLVADGVLVSYCVKTQITRRLAEIGFAVTVVSGPPGGKRQVLVARKS